MPTQRTRLVALATTIVAVAIAGAALLATRPAAVGPSPSATREPIAASDFFWAFATPLPPAAGLPRSYALQGGTLADPGPALDLEVPWVLPDRVADAARNPAASPPVAGQVVYVSDDGRRSVLHRASLVEPIESEPIIDLAEIVWTLAAAPDGSAAFLLVIDRETGADRGVVRVSLDGSRAVTPVLEPAGVVQARAAPRFAAIAMQLSLLVSADGRHLARRSCGIDGGCVLDIVELGSEHRMRYPDRDVLGLGGGLLLWMECEPEPCVIVATDLQSGVDQRIPGAIANAFLVLRGNDAVVVGTESAPDGAGHAVVATNLRSGQSVRLIEADGVAGAVAAWNPAATLDMKIAPPPGWVIVQRFGAEGASETLGVSIDGGPPVALPAAAPFRAPAQPGLNG